MDKNIKEKRFENRALRDTRCYFAPITEMILNLKSLNSIIYDRIRYLARDKSGITYSISHNFARIRTDPYNSLLVEKTLSFYNVIILIKSVVNKNK